MALSEALPNKNYLLNDKKGITVVLHRLEKDGGFSKEFIEEVAKRAPTWDQETWVEMIPSKFRMIYENRKVPKKLLTNNEEGRGLILSRVARIKDSSLMKMILNEEISLREIPTFLRQDKMPENVINQLQ